MQKLQYEKADIIPIECQSFCEFLVGLSGIKAAILFGSVARGDNNYHSDIDMALWTDDDLSLKENMLKAIENYWKEKDGVALSIPRKKSICIFTKDLQKIDVLLINNLAALNRNYLGSNITSNRILQSILFDKTASVLSYLTAINGLNIEKDETYQTDSLINYFLFAFEGCSKQHAKSDGYQFYFNYNIAFHTLIQLQCVLKGYSSFLYNPKNVFYHAWEKDNMEELYQLKGSLFLPDGNQKKRQLLDRFYKIITELAPERLASCQSLGESIYERDYFWNFRDYTAHFPSLLSNKIYRSATLSLYKDTEKVLHFLNEKNIENIIDLRAPKEVEAVAYAQNVIAQKNYIKAPFDPWNQPKWFQEKYHDKNSTNRAIAYRFFLVACQPYFQKIISTILNTKGATLIHCHAGKDRTGLVVGAIQLLLGCSAEKVKLDYMASGSDVDLKVFNLLFEEVANKGGINGFFEYQGVPFLEQQALIQKLISYMTTI